MDRSKIEWTDTTWNPIRGCSRVSEGCRNCYAERVARRFVGPGLAYEGLTERGRWNGKVRVIEEKLCLPFKWKEPRKVFVNSMSDLFHESVSVKVIAEVFAVMALAGAERQLCRRPKCNHEDCPAFNGDAENEPIHTFQVLTKRPKRMRAVLSERYFFNEVQEASRRLAYSFEESEEMIHHAGWPLKNVWLGVSVEDQKAADERIPILLSTPAAVRWISVEPMLGEINIRSWLRKCDDKNIDWVVCGGESGAGARPLYPEWARSLRDQCQEAKVPFFFKQWGEWAPPSELPPKVAIGRWDTGGPDPDGQIPKRYGKNAAGKLLDGREWSEFPR